LHQTGWVKIGAMLANERCDRFGKARGGRTHDLDRKLARKLQQFGRGHGGHRPAGCASLQALMIAVVAVVAGALGSIGPGHGMVTGALAKGALAKGVLAKGAAPPRVAPAFAAW